MNDQANHNYLLNVQNLGISFETDEGIVRGVNDVSFVVEKGKTLGIVGESGSGKSVTSQAIMRLLPKNGHIDERSVIRLHQNGNVLDITGLKADSDTMRSIRGGVISMIFQEPMASFSPVYTIGNQITESIHLHRSVNKKEAREIALDMLDRVGISNPGVRIDQYPFELSGGMRQRAMIALALSTEPLLLIADEPTTALDVTIQAQILELMRELQADLQMSIIFITHDLGVIAQIANDVVVMYLGQVMERGTTREIIKNPKHPYTKSLLKAIPKLDSLHGRLTPVGGDIPSPLSRPSGCPFHTRCLDRILDRCDQSDPCETQLFENHFVNCFLFEPEE
jgi:peptide/nickel transport system ATP-binding protein